MSDDCVLNDDESCEFGIIEEKCFFCGHPKLVRFNEHWNFCPNCSSIYASMIVMESECDHHRVKNSVICAERFPYPFIMFDVSKCLDVQEEKCLVCGAKVIADGW